MTPCMGGWCVKRGQCPNHQTPQRSNPVERLCIPGRDGIRLVDSTPHRKIYADVFDSKVAHVEAEVQ